MPTLELIQLNAIPSTSTALVIVLDIRSSLRLSWEFVFKDASGVSALSGVNSISVSFLKVFHVLLHHIFHIALVDIAEWIVRLIILEWC